MSDESTPSALIVSASWLIPSVCAVMLMGNGMGFLDAPELAAAAGGLGNTHPPGHPLWVLVHSLASVCIPIGALPLRITLISALFLALLGRSTFALSWRIARDVAQDSLSTRSQSLVALAGSFAATLGVATLRQSTRVEVYAMAGSLAIGALAILTPRELPRGARVRLALGLVALGVANHHFIAIFSAFSLLGVVAAHIKKATLKRALAPMALLLSVVVALYSVLPLRAHARASITRPQTAGQILEVATAQTFLKNTGAGVSEPIGTRLIDIVDILADSLTALGVVFALIGFFLAYRAGGTARIFTTRLATVFLFGVLGRVWLGFNSNNPDAAGYLVPAIVSLAILFSGFVAGAWRAIAQAQEIKDGPSRATQALLRFVLVATCATLPVFLLVNSAYKTAPDRANSINTLALAPLTSAAPKGILFLHTPSTIFRTRYAQLVEGERPDLTVVPVPLLAYPGMITQLIAQEPLLAPVFARYLLRPSRAIPVTLVAGLATQRAIEVELDPDNVREYLQYAVPSGSLATVLEAPSTIADVRASGARHFVRFDQIATQLDREPDAKGPFDEALLWMAFNDAVFFAARGARAESRRSIERAQQRAPQARHLQALRALLDQTPGDGPIDVSSVLPQ